MKPPAGNPAEGGHAEHRKPCTNLRNERNATRAVGRASGLWCNQDHERRTRGAHSLLTELSLCLDSPLSRQGAGSDAAQRLREATPFWEGPRYLNRDNDRKYGKSFARVASGTGIEILRTPYGAPRANAICERFLGSVRRECLD